MGAALVVQVEGVDGAAPPAKKTRYSLTLNDRSADPCAAPAVPGPADPAAADEGGEDAEQSEQRTLQLALIDGGVIERLMRNIQCTRQSVSSAEQVLPQPRQRNT